MRSLKSFAVWGDLQPRIVDDFKAAGHKPWPLPELSEPEKEALVSRYSKLISKIGEENGGDSMWWYTWTSSRDRVHSRVLSDLEFLDRFQKAIEQGFPEQLILFCPDPYLAGALQEVCREHRIKNLATITDRLQWIWRRTRMWIHPFSGTFRSCVRAVIIKWKLRNLEIDLGPAKSARERTILITWIRSGNLTEDSPPTDTFFGQLPDHLANKHRSTVIFGDLIDGLPAKHPKHRSNSPTPVLTMGMLLPISSIIVVLLKGLFSRINVRNTVRLEPNYLKSLLRKDIHNNLDSIVYGLLIEKALGRLINDYQPTQMIHMCENNPWERACTRAINCTYPKPENVGYMHCAVLKAHTKILITEEERKVRPRPSKLICTGPLARDLMVRYGGHSPDEVVAGCALRHGYLESMALRSTLNRPIKNILVVLEGLPSMSPFVRFVFEALETRPEFNTVIRPHQAFPFNLILHHAGLSVSDFNRVRISQNAQIASDFENTDLVIYMGSTAAVEAGYMGIPLIHYKHPNLLTDDPLFEITSLKKIAATPTELFSAIQEYESMDDAEYANQAESLRNYIKNYLTIPSPQTTSVFLHDKTPAD